MSLQRESPTVFARIIFVFPDVPSVEKVDVDNFGRQIYCSDGERAVRWNEHLALVTILRYIIYATRVSAALWNRNADEKFVLELLSTRSFAARSDKHRRPDNFADLEPCDLRMQTIV